MFPLALENTAGWYSPYTNRTGKRSLYQQKEDALPFCLPAHSLSTDFVLCSLFRVHSIP